MLKVTVLCLLLGVAFASGQTTEEVPSPEAPTDGTETPEVSEVIQVPPEEPVRPTCSVENILAAATAAGEDFSNTTCNLPPSDCANTDRFCDFKIASDGGGAGSCDTCEGTLPALSQALEQGANAVRLHVCLSRDNVPFVWFDCKMDHPVAISRRLGRFLAGKCAPYMDPRAIGKNAEDLDFADIEQYWGYKSDWTQCVKSAGATVPRLQSVFQLLVNDPRVSAVVITRRGKIANEALYKLAYIVFQLARCSGILDRVLFVISSPEQIPIVQCAVVAAGGLGRQVAVHFELQISDIGNEQDFQQALTIADQAITQICASGAPQLPASVVANIDRQVRVLQQQAVQALTNPINLQKLMKTFQPVKLVRNYCIHGVIITRPDIPTGADMQRVVTLRALERRGKNQPHLHIYSDAVSSREEISWLVRHGVDGLVSTDVAVARATYDTLHEVGKWLGPDHCPLPFGYSRPVLPPNPARPPPFIDECIDTSGNPQALNTFNKVLSCWARLLARYYAALASTVTPPAA